MSNKPLLLQLLKISTKFQGAVQKGVKKATRELLKLSVRGMKRDGKNIRTGADGVMYYTTPNTTNTLRVLTGDLKGSLLAASEGSNLSGGIFKSEFRGGAYHLTFGSSIVDVEGESYPRKHDQGRFAFLRRRFDGDVYIKRMTEEINKIWR